ncbi:hypothetical protein BV898_07413 [Hypsibius exemplaris]|uniref:Uncharacterized protein n=1 Tax=Hypsibius exemplaris TaxID=2072580 RepID=A0A1W0WTW2_HYPEX|nr:hypothetical protein BV898_07413 [Hypsibius exemplaris]
MSSGSRYSCRGSGLTDSLNPDVFLAAMDDTMGNIRDEMHEKFTNMGDTLCDEARDYQGRGDKFATWLDGNVRDLQQHIKDQFVQLQRQTRILRGIPEDEISDTFEQRLSKILNEAHNSYEAFRDVLSNRNLTLSHSGNSTQLSDIPESSRTASTSASGSRTSGTSNSSKTSGSRSKVSGSTSSSGSRTQSGTASSSSGSTSKTSGSGSSSSRTGTTANEFGSSSNKTRTGPSKSATGTSSSSEPTGSSSSSRTGTASWSNVSKTASGSASASSPKSKSVVWSPTGKSSKQVTGSSGSQSPSMESLSRDLPVGRKVEGSGLAERFASEQIDSKQFTLRRPLGVASSSRPSSQSRNSLVLSGGPSKTATTTLSYSKVTGNKSLDQQSKTSVTPSSRSTSHSTVPSRSAASRIQSKMSATVSSNHSSDDTYSEAELDAGIPTTLDDDSEIQSSSRIKSGRKPSNQLTNVLSKVSSHSTGLVKDEDDSTPSESDAGEEITEDTPTTESSSSEEDAPPIKHVSSSRDNISRKSRMGQSKNSHVGPTKAATTANIESVSEEEVKPPSEGDTGSDNGSTTEDETTDATTEGSDTEKSAESETSGSPSSSETEDESDIGSVSSEEDKAKKKRKKRNHLPGS